MKKYLLGALVLAFCSIVLAQTIKDGDYPNVEPFMQFWTKLQDKIKTGKVDLSKNYDIRIQTNFSEKKVSKGDLKFYINENSPEMLELLKEFSTAVDDSNLLKVVALDSLNEDITSADLQIKFDETDVHFKVAVKSNSEISAQNIASRFRLIFGLTARIVEENPEEEFYKNAVITTEKEQVFVHGKISRANLQQFLNNL